MSFQESDEEGDIDAVGLAVAIDIDCGIERRVLRTWSHRRTAISGRSKGSLKVVNSRHDINGIGSAIVVDVSRNVGTTAGANIK